MSLIINPFSVQAVASGPTPITRLTFGGSNITDTGSQAATFSVLGTPAYVDRDAGKALDLSAAQLLVYKEAWDKLSGASAATLKFKVNRLSVTAQKTMVKWGTWIQVKIDGGSLVGLVTNSASTAYWANGNTTMSANAWHDVCLQFSSAGVKLYLDGVQDMTTVSATGSFGTSGFPDLEIGAYETGSCYIDEVEIYDSVVAP